MAETSPEKQNFIAAKVYEAVFKTQQAEEIITLELRTRSDRTTTLFTVIDNQETRAASIPSLLLIRPDCISLSIAHTLDVQWNDVRKKCTLTEIFLPEWDNRSFVPLKIALMVDDETYLTSVGISFTEVMSDLHDVIRPRINWRLVTCYDCKYSRPAFLGPTSDRDELRCFRDTPTAFRQIEQTAKFVSGELLHAGDYFVDAFHRCAAWPPTSQASD